jgi:hypothetical protein
LGISFSEIDTGWCVGWNLSDDSGRIFKYSATTDISHPSSAASGLEVRTIPNPFTTEMRFAWEVASAAAEISIYDVTGKSVWTQEGGITAIADIRELRWNGRDRSGRPVPCGVYLYRIETGTSVMTGRMMKVR